MRIIHCADLHLDSKMTANLSYEKAKERKAELLITFNNMIRYAVEQSINAIIIAGDLFDTKNTSATARNTVYEAIRNHPNIIFYYLKGNHDADVFLSRLETIPDNLKMFSDRWVSYIVNENTYNNIIITGIELDKNNTGSASDTLTLDHNKFNIVVLHGQEMEHQTKDRAEVIALRSFRNKGIDYMALGHLHSYKEVALDARGVYCYPGCLEGRGFDECGEHGFVLLTINEETKECKRSFIPIARRELCSITIDISTLLTTPEILSHIRETLQRKQLSCSSLVKIVLTGQVSLECEKDIDYMAKELENDYYFLKIYDNTEIKVNYSDYELDESLKGEFIRTVKSSEDLSEEDKAMIIFYGIQALQGKEI